MQELKHAEARKLNNNGIPTLPPTTVTAPPQHVDGDFTLQWSLMIAERGWNLGGPAGDDQTDHQGPSGPDDPSSEIDDEYLQATEYLSNHPALASVPEAAKNRIFSSRSLSIELSKFLKETNASLVFGNTGSGSGLYDPASNTITINENFISSYNVNPDHYDEMIAGAIAHEVGHFITYHSITTVTSDIDSYVNSQITREALAIVYNLLVSQEGLGIGVVAMNVNNAWENLYITFLQENSLDNLVNSIRSSLMQTQMKKNYEDQYNEIYGRKNE